MKKLLFLIPLFLLGFNSQYTPALNKDFSNLQCNQVLHKTAFDICYSCKYKHPLAVAYTLKGYLVKKKISRKGLYFRPDYSLPARCRSYTKNYSRTGFDRGHNAPNAAFDYNRAIQKQTFLLSNITPQKPQLNRRLWAKIEKFARVQAIRYGKVQVITGNCGNIGKIKNNVGVPAYWYKIIYIPQINKTISFLAPNTNTGMSRAKAKEFLSSLKEIEKVCGVKIKK